MNFDEKKFEAYMNKHSGVMYGFFQNRVNNWSVSEILVQDLFVKVYKYAIAKHEYPTLPYLYTMAKNLTIDHYRSEGRKPGMTNVETTPEVLFPEIPYQEYESELDAESFWEQFSPLGLSDKEKTIFWEMARHGLTVREIQDKLGVAKSSVHDIYKKTVAKLRKFLSDDIAAADVLLSNE